jgi:hypothetical protein
MLNVAADILAIRHDVMFGNTSDSFLAMMLKRYANMISSVVVYYFVKDFNRDLRHFGVINGFSANLWDGWRGSGKRGKYC